MKTNVRRGEDVPVNAEELAGLIEIGMGKDALAMAAKVLDGRHPDPDEVFEAIRAIGVFARKAGTWKPQIEALIARSSKKALHAMRECFLLYFATIKDYERAAEFVRAPRSFCPAIIFMAVEALLATGRSGEARKLVAKVSVSDIADMDYLGEAAASVASVYGEHAEAWELRRSCPCTGPISRDLVEGMVKSALALTIGDLDRRLAELEEQMKVAAFDDTALSVPGNQTGLLEDNAAAYRKWRRKLVRLFPKKDLPRYALGSSS